MSCHGLLAVARPLAEEITSDPDWMALLGRHGDAVLDLLAITTGVNARGSTTCRLRDAVHLAAAVFEVNGFGAWRMSSRRFRTRPSDSRADAAFTDELGWDSAVSPDPPGTVWRRDGLHAHVQGANLSGCRRIVIERQQLAQLGIHAVASQGEKRGIELQRDLLKD